MTLVEFQQLRHFDNDSPSMWGRMARRERRDIIAAAGTYTMPGQNDERRPTLYLRKLDRSLRGNQYAYSLIMLCDFSGGRRPALPPGSRLRLTSRGTKSHVLQRLEKEWMSS